MEVRLGQGVCCIQHVMLISFTGLLVALQSVILRWVINGSCAWVKHCVIVFCFLFFWLVLLCVSF